MPVENKGLQIVISADVVIMYRGTELGNLFDLPSDLTI